MYRRLGGPLDRDKKTVKNLPLLSFLNEPVDRYSPDIWRAQC